MHVNNDNKARKPFTSPIDPDFECIPIDSQTSNGPLASPPPGGKEEHSNRRLCPEGYIPRRKRKSYKLQGKVIIDPAHAPERNPRTRD